MIKRFIGKFGWDMFPWNSIREDGELPRSVAATVSSASAIPAVGSGQSLWVRVTCDGSQVEVRCAAAQAGLATASVCYRGTFEGKIRGGHIGFAGPWVDDVTIRTDPNNNGSFSKVEMIEQFNTDPVEIRHDAAGNLTFDGNYAYIYDAWGRQIKVKRAYITKDAQGTKTYHEGSVISTSTYDGFGRRVKKQITNSGDMDYTYVYYHDGNRIIEERNGSGILNKTYVWGQQYIDELVQLNVYSVQIVGMIDVGPVHAPVPQPFWAMQDANYNVIGIVNKTGRQVERYEYTPYGQRTIYGRKTVLSDSAEAATWGNDAMLTYPQLTSARITESSIAIMFPPGTGPEGLCNFGFQGKMHDSVTGQIRQGVRMYSPNIQIFMTPDPGEYIDGPNRYQPFGRNPVIKVDPDGKMAILVEVEDTLPKLGDPPGLEKMSRQRMAKFVSIDLPTYKNQIAEVVGALNTVTDRQFDNLQKGFNYSGFFVESSFPSHIRWMGNNLPLFPFSAKNLYTDRVRHELKSEFYTLRTCRIEDVEAAVRKLSRELQADFYGLEQPSDQLFIAIHGDQGGNVSLSGFPYPQKLAIDKIMKASLRPNLTVIGSCYQDGYLEYVDRENLPKASVIYRTFPGNPSMGISGGREIHMVDVMPLTLKRRIGGP